LNTQFIPIKTYAGKTEPLQGCNRLPEVPHACVSEQLYAVNAALATRRPLLVRGEPGTGKSQLARAAAQLLGRRFLQKVVDARTEISDLFYHFDAVERLGHAQLLGSLGAHVDTEKLINALDSQLFLRPGPLWKAFCWPDAVKQEQRYRERGAAIRGSYTPEEGRMGNGGAQAQTNKSSQGCVVLIDEIDKADPSVPNGLLEALGQGTFPVPGTDRVISWHQDACRPLVVLTTNESRELPDAFVRRCLVLHILLPEGDVELRNWLVDRGRVHFAREQLAEKVLESAAQYVVEDRKKADEFGLAKPGQAEYIDLLRAIYELSQGGEKPMDLLETLRSFALHKHREVYRQVQVVKSAKARP